MAALVVDIVVVVVDSVVAAELAAGVRVVVAMVVVAIALVVIAIAGVERAAADVAPGSILKTRVSLEWVKPSFFYFCRPRSILMMRRAMASVAA